MLRVLAVACFVGALALVGSASAGPRQPAPNIAGPTVQGATASLAALRGKPVFVNVWSSW